MSTDGESRVSKVACVPVLPSEVEARLRVRASHLIMLPAVATKALEIVKDPACSIQEFSAVVERDAVLAADVLRLSNSILFGASRPILNLHQAVVRLGIRQCKNLIYASSFGSMLKKMTLSEERVCESLWRHSFITALLAQKLNQSLDAGFQGEEFAGGLMHDIGRMLLAICFSVTFEENAEILDAEAEAIETNHCEVGAWFIQKNNLPAAFFDAVRFHHNPELSEDHRRFVALIAASDHMANHLDRATELPEYEPQQNLAIGLLEECGVAQASSRFQVSALDIMQAVSREAAEKQML